jgi:CMP-N,N'-diacetyllegionaminic acid synthase
MKIIAIIPARSGSKGIKDKNITILNDKPLIVYSIDAALESKIFDEVMVSTDSIKYADLAKQNGASVPFLRPSSLSEDNSNTWDVVKDVLANYERLGFFFDIVFVLQPTSPLRNSNDIKNAYSLMIKNNANFVASVCEVDHSPLWANTLPDNKNMMGFISPEIFNKPRQEIKKYYRLNGAIYIVNTSFLKSNYYLFDENSYAYVMSKETSVDIDDTSDLNFASCLLNGSIH